MKRLPNDVAQLILRTLAAQDPESFFQAVFACKRFYEAVEQYPGAWRDAYFASARQDGPLEKLAETLQHLLILHQAWRTPPPTESEDLSTLFRGLRGFKLLVRALWAEDSAVLSRYGQSYALSEEKRWRRAGGRLLDDPNGKFRSRPDCDCEYWACECQSG